MNSKIFFICLFYLIIQSSSFASSYSLLDTEYYRDVSFRGYDLLPFNEDIHSPGNLSRGESYNEMFANARTVPGNTPQAIAHVRNTVHEEDDYKIAVASASILYWVRPNLKDRTLAKRFAEGFHLPLTFEYKLEANASGDYIRTPDPSGNKGTYSTAELSFDNINNSSDLLVRLETDFSSSDCQSIVSNSINCSTSGKFTANFGLNKDGDANWGVVRLSAYALLKGGETTAYAMADPLFTLPEGTLVIDGIEYSYSDIFEIQYSNGLMVVPIPPAMLLFFSGLLSLFLSFRFQNIKEFIKYYYLEKILNPGCQFLLSLGT